MAENKFKLFIPFFVIAAAFVDVTYSDGDLQDECGGISVRQRISEMTTWQSAAMFGTCLMKRHQLSLQGGLSDRADNSRYWFHTGYATNFPDDPYNWLVIKLPEPILLLSITARFELRHFLMLASSWGNESHGPAAARGSIEALVSPDKWDLGDEHCQASLRNTTTLPRSVVDGKYGWKFCTIIRPPSQSLTSDYWCRGSGGILTRTLLLRKAIAATRHDRFMSFADLILRQAFYVSAQPLTVIQGHPLLVECVSCGRYDALNRRRQQMHEQQLLCSSIGNREMSGQWGEYCVDRQVSVSSAEPRHAGTYQCRRTTGFNATAKVDVLYGPNHLKIDYTLRKTSIQESANENSVGEAQRLSIELEIRFATSDAYPAPRHSCAAVITNAESADKHILALSKSVTRRTSSQGALESAWLASPGPKSDGWPTNSSVMVKCTAMQTVETSRGLYQGQFGLHRRIRLLLSDSATDTPNIGLPKHLLAPLITASVVASILVALLLIGLALVCAAKRAARLRLLNIRSYNTSTDTNQTAATTAASQCSCFATHQRGTRLNLVQVFQQGAETNGVYDEPVEYIN